MNFKTVQNESSEGMHAVHYTAGDNTEIHSKTYHTSLISNLHEASRKFRYQLSRKTTPEYSKTDICLNKSKNDKHKEKNVFIR